MSARGGESQPLAWVDREIAVLDRAAVDHLQRLEGVADRTRVGTGREQVVDESLHVTTLDLGEPGTAERGEDVETKRALVLAHDRRLVPLAGLRAGRAARDSLDEGLCGLKERPRRAGEADALRSLRLRPSPPATRFAERPESLRDLALADRVVRRDAVTGIAVAALAATRGARAGVTDFDPLGHQARPTVALVALRSNQRSSSATVIRMRRPRRTKRSSSSTWSSK